MPMCNDWRSQKHTHMQIWAELVCLQAISAHLLPTDHCQLTDHWRKQHLAQAFDQEAEQVKRKGRCQSSSPPSRTPQLNCKRSLGVPSWQWWQWQLQNISIAVYKYLSLSRASMPTGHLCPLNANWSLPTYWPLEEAASSTSFWPKSRESKKKR